MARERSGHQPSCVWRWVQRYIKVKGEERFLYRAVDSSGQTIDFLSTAKRHGQLRQCKYLNNVMEQDHRNVKCRTWLAKGNGSVRTAWRTLHGIEAMSMIRKGRVRRAGKGDVVAQVKFISSCSASPSKKPLDSASSRPSGNALSLWRAFWMGWLPKAAILLTCTISARSDGGMRS
jgi:hypothetical protein